MGRHTWITPFRYLPGFLLFRHSPRFYPFPVLTQTLLRYSPESHLSSTHPDPFLVLTQTLLRYSPGFHLSGTRPDSTLCGYSPRPFFGTSPDSTFLALARILPFLVLAWTFLWYSPRFPPFRYSLGFYPSSVLARISTFPALSQILHFLGTHPDPSPVLARIPPFWYSPGSHLSGTCPDPTFPVLARISTFSALAQILPFPSTHSDPSYVLARIPPFRYSPGSTLLRYLLGFHFSGTCLDFYHS